MKFFRFLWFFLCLFIFAQSCKKEYHELWKKEIPSTEQVKVIDISGEYFNTSIPLEQFKTKYPWFQGTVSDEDFALRRKDSMEIKIYQESIKKINTQQLQSELNTLFSMVKHYFPKFKTPTVFLYSSSLQGITDPIFFKTQEGMLFVDISAFLGEKHEYFKGMDDYQLKIMNPENMLPRISEIVSESFINPNQEQNKFIDQMVNGGKIMILQDAFLPKTADPLKISYTQAQYDWAVSNEGNIWNYFVEKDLVFSDDEKLGERFLSYGPFSKFYTEIDQKSSPKIGIFTGWQIAKAYFQKNPETTLPDFMRMSATDIFNKSGYKPE